MDKDKNKILFTVNDFTVYAGRTYKIIDKTDGDAPSGFVKEGVSKLPSDGIDESFGFVFIPHPGQSKRGVWNTGFHNASACYKGMESKEIAAIVKQRTENVLKPYRQAAGEPDALSLENPASLDSTSFSVYSGKLFHMDLAEHVMGIYAALITKSVAPKGQEKSAEYSRASYVVVDVTKENHEKEDDSVSIMSAISEFNALYDTDKEKLDVVLEWVKLGKYPANCNKKTMSGIFYQTITSGKDSAQKCRLFLEAIDESENTKDRDKMYIFKMLTDMNGRNPKLKVGERGKIFFGEHEVGADFRTAAEQIAKNPDLAMVRSEILTGKED